MTRISADNSNPVEIEPLEGGRHRIRVYSGDRRRVLSQWDSSYSEDLIRLIYEVKGEKSFLDEIRRDEDRQYVSACLESDIFGYVAGKELAGKRLLDFGCGAGASTMILRRMLPETEIVGLELSEKALTIARARKEFYGFEHIKFHLSPSGDSVPADLGKFDYILFSAVYEHLLPDERRDLLPRIWSLLKPGGVFFLDQTPWRYFPFEGHTTRLPIINYLPDKLALVYARTFSKRVGKNETWQGLLRRGIRGGTVKDIMKNIRNACSDSKEHPILLKPSGQGVRDRIDLWHAGYAISISRKYPWAKPVQLILKLLLKIILFTTGIVVVPSLSLAIKKPLCHA